MFYQLLKAYARLAIHLYCTKVVVNKTELLKIKGPVLFAANHPNSFLDGIILSTLLDETLYSLTRGDVFRNKTIARILAWFKLLPIYRTSEGTQNLAQNYITFAACHNIFKKNKIVLIFSEARSVNEWQLRHLRKGTARLAFSSWQQGIDVKVIPLGFNYSSFKTFGKEVHLNFGEEIKHEAFKKEDTDGKQLNAFTQMVWQQLRGLVYQANHEEQAKKFFSPPANRLKTAFLFIPGIISCLVHVPLFYLCRLVTELGFGNNDHYDGVLTALLLLLYPVYILALAVFAGSYHFFLGLLTIILLPLLVRCWLQIKYLFE